MKYRTLISLIIVALSAASAYAQEFNSIPRSWKWLGNEEVIFTYDGTFKDEGAFAYNVKNGKRREGVKAPAKFAHFPLVPKGAVNLTYSPDSTMLADRKSVV